MMGVYKYWVQAFCKMCASHVEPKPTLSQELAEEAELLNRDTISRELKLIDDECKILANQRKAEYLLNMIAKVSTRVEIPNNIVIDRR